VLRFACYRRSRATLWHAARGHTPIRPACRAVAAAALVGLPALAGYGPARRASLPPAPPAYRHYEVGAYYFSGWAHGPNDNVSPLLTGHMQPSEPLIGWYDDSQGAVDQSINQAADSGIDFFAFDWYDVAQSPYITDQSLNEGLDFYLTSRVRHRLKFCLNFVDSPPFVPPAGDWLKLIRTWIGYFRQPDYVRVSGKPLFIVYSPEYMRAIFGGSAGVRRALDVLRAQARAAGLPGVTVAVAATITPQVNPVHVQELNAEGYDAATGYSYHSLGGERYNVPVPYARLVQENVAMWSRVPARVPIPYIPVITSGFDLRYSEREQQRAIIYAGRTPSKLACYALLARRWIDTHPKETTRERIVLVYAWTELGEGGAIIPNRQDGYGYVYALRTVFGAPSQAPTTPAYCR
jgi:hypothetical protein